MTVAALAGAIATELEAMARSTEGLAEELCRDAEMAQRCLPLLQQFDLLAQQQGEIARLVRALGEGREVDQALGDIRLAALADRLGRSA